MEGSDPQQIFHLVDKRIPLDPAPPGPTRGSRLMLIGKHLDPER